MIYLYGDYIVSAVVQIRSQVKGKRRVSIRMGSHLMSIDIHSGVHVHAVEIHADLLCGSFLRNCEILSVPSGSSRKIAALCLHIWRVILLNAVVMGQTHCLPLGVVEIDLLCIAGISQEKLPVAVEVLRTNRSVIEIHKYCLRV